MKIKTLLLPIIALAIMVALGACSNEELIPDAKPDTNPQTGRTLSLTASMPSEPTTRVGLTKEDDLSITLTWQAGDELQLAFVQGTTKAKSVATVKTISTNKKQATFDIEIPDGFDTGVYDLYGVYGGGGLSDANPTQVQLPTNAGNTTSLSGDEATSVQNRKDVILYFESKNIDAENPQATAIFQHLGSLFSFTLQNNGAVAIDDIKEVRLSSDEANNNWGYNTGSGNQVYDFETGFQNTETGSDYYIYFDATDRSIAAGEPLTFWAWYPPLPNVNWPSLKIELITTDNSTVASANTLPARDNPTAAGKSYYFYAAWDESELNFTNEAFTNELTVDVAEMGTLSNLLSATQKANTTKLTLTGQINKADYDVMKLEMPSLTYVDLSKVTSYEGEIMNKIPDFAFGDIDMTSEEDPFVDANQTIETVILPQSTTVIGDGTFIGCMGIISALNIPENVTTIGDMAFAASGFTGSLTIPNRVTTIGDQAFALSNFSSLTFQDGIQLTTIGEGAFMQCENLTGELKLPASLTTIGDGAFQLCNNLTGELILPANLVIIGDDAFSDCRFSGSLSIPDKVTKIGDSAFYGSKFTGSLIIPKEVITIGDYAFQFCGFTGSLSFQDGSKLEAIGRLSFSDCGFTGPLVLPANLQTIGEKAFLDCEGFTGNIVFPSTLTSIGKESFVSCNLVDAFQFMSVTPIKYTDLMLAEGKLVKVPSTVAAAKYEATSGWTPRHTIEGLFDGHAVHVATKGTLSAILTHHDYALADITNLKLTGEINNADYEVMKSQMPNLRVVDLGQVTSYEGETVNKIPDKAFGHIFINEANQTISTIILPENTTVIGKSAFLFCKKLSGNLILPTSLVTIESAAFMHCTGLTGNLVLPAGLKTVGLDAFSGCTGFDGSLTLPATLETIEGAAFANCENIIGKIVFPSKLTSIEYSGFYGCTSITAFQFPHTTPITYTDDMLTPGTTVEVPLSAISLYLDNPDWVPRHPISVLVEVEVEVPPL